MAAPKGNKYAVGNIGNPYSKGVPALTSDEDLICLGQHMVSWFKANPDEYLVQAYCMANNVRSRSVTYWGFQRECFKEYYDAVRDICGYRIVTRCGKDKGVHPALALRFLSMYFTDLKEHEREIKEEAQKQTEKILYNIIKYNPTDKAKAA